PAHGARRAGAGPLRRPRGHRASLRDRRRLARATGFLAGDGHSPRRLGAASPHRRGGREAGRGARYLPRAGRLPGGRLPQGHTADDADAGRREAVSAAREPTGAGGPALRALVLVLAAMLAPCAAHAAACAVPTPAHPTLQSAVADGA